MIKDRLVRYDTEEKHEATFVFNSKKDLQRAITMMTDQFGQQSVKSVDDCNAMTWRKDYDNN